MGNKKFITIIIVFFLLVFFSFSVFSEVSHRAEEIKPGVFGGDFGGGNFSFLDNLTVSGFVGIGTSSPSYDLDVVGDFHVSSFGWGGDGSLEFTVSGSGVGISSGTFSPSYMLDVNGKVNGQQLCIANDCRTSWPDPSLSGWSRSNGVVSLVTSSDNVSANTFFVDNTNGRVGIGTTSPVYDFDVNGSFRVSNGSGFDLSVNPLSINPLWLKSSWHINMILDRTGTEDFLKLMTGSSYSGLVFGSNNTFSIGVDSYNNRNSDGLGNGVFFITPSGNVGINTSSPSAPLHVVSGSSPAVVLEGDPDIRLVSTPGVSSMPQVKFYNGSVFRGEIGYQNSNDYLYLAAGGSTSPRILINASGHVAFNSSSLYSDYYTVSIFAGRAPLVLNTSFDANVDMLRFAHPNTTVRFHVDIYDNLELGIGRSDGSVWNWNVMNFDPDNGHVSLGADPSSTYRLYVNSGSDSAIYGYSSGSFKYGVYGVSSGSSGVGVYGYASASDGMGVEGYAIGSSGIGSYGYATGSSGYGVYGFATGSSGRGVYGYADGSSGYGVYGYDSYNYGVYCYGDKCGGNKAWTTSSDVRIKDDVVSLNDYVSKNDVFGSSSEKKNSGFNVVGFVSKKFNDNVSDNVVESIVSSNSVLSRVLSAKPIVYRKDIKKLSELRLLNKLYFSSKSNSSFKQFLVEKGLWNKLNSIPRDEWDPSWVDVLLKDKDFVSFVNSSGVFDEVELSNLLNVSSEKVSNVEVGFSAQELKDIFPEVVVWDNASGTYGITYSELIPYLFEAIKELNNKVDGKTTINTNINNNSNTTFSNGCKFISDEKGLHWVC